MVSTTANLAIPYLDYADPPDIPKSGKLPADKIDDLLGPFVDWTVVASINSGGGWTAASGDDTPEAMLRYKRVDLRGGFSNGSFSSATPTRAANLPTGIPAPAVDMEFPIVGSSATRIGYCVITAAGQIQFAVANATTSSAFFRLGGIGWPVP
jgi:hypothetical protein